MSVCRHFKISVLAATFAAIPAVAFGLPSPSILLIPDEFAAVQDTQQNEAAEGIAAVDYCYTGSISDPTTGEIIDLYVLCEGDGVEENLDLA